MTDPVVWYDINAGQVTGIYDSLNAGDIHSGLTDRFPPPPAKILDIGAGSGRDVVWLTGLGHHVTAVEPSAGMRRRAMSRHRDAGILWLDDRLPGLEKVSSTGLRYDLVLLSAVWMHLPPPDRPEAFAAMAALLRERTGRAGGGGKNRHGKDRDHERRQQPGGSRTGCRQGQPAILH